MADYLDDIRKNLTITGSSQYSGGAYYSDFDAEPLTITGDDHYSGGDDSNKLKKMEDSSQSIEQFVQDFMNEQDAFIKQSIKKDPDVSNFIQDDSGDSLSESDDSAFIVRDESDDESDNDLDNDLDVKFGKGEFGEINNILNNYHNRI